MAIKANLFVDQGTDYSTSINLTDDEGGIIVLTGYSSNGQIRKTYSSTNAVSFGITLEANTGLVVLQLTDTQTTAMTAGRYVYDVYLTDQFGITSRIVEGIVTVTPSVTR